MFHRKLIRNSKFNVMPLKYNLSLKIYMAPQNRTYSQISMTICNQIVHIHQMTMNH